jgi:hypothetical protein
VYAQASSATTRASAGFLGVKPLIFVAACLGIFDGKARFGLTGFAAACFRGTPTTAFTPAVSVIVRSVPRR